MQVSKRWPDGAEQAVDGYTVVCLNLDCILGGNDEWWCDTEAEAAEAWNTRATHGTLTAEQVSRAAYAHSIHADCADADWQAIADELNATLGEPKRAVCSKCGTLLSDYILCTPCAEKFAVKR